MARAAAKSALINKRTKQPKQLRTDDGTVLDERTRQNIQQYRSECAEYCVNQVEYLNAEIVRVKANVMRKIDEFLNYAGLQGASNIRSKKGGFSLDTADGLKRIVVQTAEIFTTNEQLQVARRLIDECVSEWTGNDTKSPLAILVGTTFRVNKQGSVDVRLLKQLRQETRHIEDSRWREAMERIDEAISVMSTKTYYRFTKRSSVDDEFKSVDLNFNTINPAENGNAK